MQVIGVLVFLTIALSQIVLGVIGLEYLIGWGGPIIAFVLLGTLNITFPFTIGVFFAATEVFGWPWYTGALIAMPGLLFVVPSILLSIVEWMKSGRRA